jgi:preprotein translocase subunit YajC
MDPSLIFPLLIVLLAVLMFMQTRRQRRAMRNQQEMQKSLSPGDRVMTTSGLLATIVGTTDEHVELEIAPGVVTTWVLAAVREKVNTDDAESDIPSEAPEPVDTTVEREAEDEVEESKTS